MSDNNAGKKISNWGNYPEVVAHMNFFDHKLEVKRLQTSLSEYSLRGNGRSYGDSALASNIISSLKYNNILSFDEQVGVIKCQSGVLFSELLKVIMPRGWFLPVTPGTKFITVGGAVASDVHGKNHHKEGSFSNHIIEMEIMAPDGEIYRCSQTENEDLFQATCGGMGLLGLILNVTFRLKPIQSGYIKMKTMKARNLEEAFEIFDKYVHYTYSMSWIDCLASGKNMGRSVIMVGEHAESNDLNRSQLKDPYIENGKKTIGIPFNFPSFVLNPLSIKTFNWFYYHKNLKREKDSIIDYNSFFYPLDSILNWNRMYGKRGFLQYQFVLPLENSMEGLKEILGRISKSGMGSFLAVLKLFGDQESLISFPMKGYTLALDFPIRKGLFALLDELDKIVVKHDGRIYFTKDARVKGEVFRQGYSEVDRFLTIVNKYNPGRRCTSIQASRLFEDS